MNMAGMIIGLLAFLLAIHISLRLIVTSLAKNDKFFISPNLGRIKARVRAGKIIQYIGNLRGFNKRVEESTGYVIQYEEAPARWFDLIWLIYGVRFIGLDEVREYQIEITSYSGNDASGKPIISKQSVTATSVHFQGSYYLFLQNVATKERTEVNILIGFTTETVHAGKTLKYPNWIGVVNRAVASFTREYISKIRMTEVNEIAAEKNGTANEGFVRELLSVLNHNNEGNPGLDETVGQQILTVNILAIDYSDTRVQDASQAEELAKRTAAAAIAEADGRLVVAERDAKAQMELNKPVVQLLADSVRVVGGGDVLARIKQAESLGKLNNLPGTLVWNEAGATPPSLIVDTKGRR